MSIALDHAAAPASTRPWRFGRLGERLEMVAALVLAALWVSPLLFAPWAAFHPPLYATALDPTSPFTGGFGVSSGTACSATSCAASMKRSISSGESESTSPMLSKP